MAPVEFSSCATVGTGRARASAVASPGPESSAPYNPLIPDINLDGNNDNIDKELLAQWCINVVDFRDADSICTPFKYDKEPWDGWDEDPNISSGDIDAYDTSDHD